MDIYDIVQDIAEAADMADCGTQSDVLASVVEVLEHDTSNEVVIDCAMEVLHPLDFNNRDFFHAAYRALFLWKLLLKVRTDFHVEV